MDALDRLHRRLVEAVHRAAPDALSRPLTIADVYQHLVPYRLVRGELGIVELQEYEHTLLRLLSGERNYLKPEVEKVAQEFAKELRSPNPLLGIYRDYAGVGVLLNPAATVEAMPAREAAAAATAAERGTLPTPLPPSPSAPAVQRDAPPARDASGHGAPADRRGAAGSPVGAGSSLREVHPPAVASGEPTLEILEMPVTQPSTLTRADCWSCREPLPREREVRFCPYCGLVQVQTPCEECSAPLDPEWKFCVACGSARAALPLVRRE
jgi:hypothetical protein